MGRAKGQTHMTATVSRSGFDQAFGAQRGLGLAPLRVPSGALSPDILAFLATLDYTKPPSMAEPATAARTPFIKSRYPYTYAYDYVRGSVPNGSESARGDIGAQIAEFAGGDYARKDEICLELAEAYLAQHGIELPTDSREKHLEVKKRARAGMQQVPVPTTGRTA